MKVSNTFAVQPGWRLLLKDIGIRATDVLRRAGLPDDLFTRPSAALSTVQYFDFWRALEKEADDPLLPLRVGRAISVESFDTPIFAALCSPDLNTALRRISRYKKLMCPMVLHVDEGAESTQLEVEWLDKTISPPDVLVAVELIFFVQLARLATRERIEPLALTTPQPPQPASAYTEYFGRSVKSSPRHTIVFSAVDAARPFLTANEAMWEFFQPELRKRLCELDETARVMERVRGALLELLPSGAPSLPAVARRLAVSPRTLQRLLRSEGVSFRQILNATREELARHYLTSSTMSGTEISFLLGFEDPNSFFRAFHAWTGETPEQARLAASQPAN